MTKAHFSSTCHLCERRIPKGSPIGKDIIGMWVHLGCSEADHAKLAVASGETFRSRKPKTWKRR